MSLLYLALSCLLVGTLHGRLLRKWLKLVHPVNFIERTSLNFKLLTATLRALDWHEACLLIPEHTNKKEINYENSTYNDFYTHAICFGTS